MLVKRTQTFYDNEYTIEYIPIFSQLFITIKQCGNNGDNWDNNISIKVCHTRKHILEILKGIGINECVAFLAKQILTEYNNAILNTPLTYALANDKMFIEALCNDIKLCIEELQ